MAQDEVYVLDDKYTDGIWYNVHDGDFTKIQRGVNDDYNSDDGRTVEFVEPETGDVYWDMPVSEWVEDEQFDFRKVSDEAVDDPVEVVNRAIRIMQRNNINELSGVPVQFAIDLKYARRHVNVEPK